VAARQLARHGLFKQLAQADGGDDEGLDLASAQARQAQVDHLQPFATGQRHEIAARIELGALAQRGHTGQLGFQLHLFAADLAEQRRRIGRVFGRNHAAVGIAVLDPQQAARAAQQLGSIGMPARRLGRFPQQGLQALQLATAQLLGAGRDFGDGLLDLLLSAGRFIAERQSHQQRLRHQQQADQRAPQQRPAPAAPPQLRCGGGEAFGGVKLVVVDHGVSARSIGGPPGAAMRSFAYRDARTNGAHWRPASRCP